MRKVFLDDLPRWRFGKFKLNGEIDWKKSLNSIIPFIYDDVEGTLKIINYDGKHLYIKYNNEEIFKIQTDNLKKCRLGIILKKITNEFKFNIGDKINDENSTRDLIITNTFREKGYKYYKYKCNVCGWDNGKIDEYNLLKGIGCSCCSGRTAVLGINTLWDTDKWIIPYVGEKIAKTHTKGNCEYVNVTCPDCGNTKNRKKKIYQIYQTHSIGCPICGDGVSQPQKIMINILKQLNVNFQTEYSPNWVKPKRFDFYLQEYNIIIEMDGKFHYIHNELSGQSAEESQKIDKYKDEKAKENGINVIRINCYNSEFEFIKDNILNELSSVFNLNKIDWNEVKEYSISNFLKRACDIKREYPNYSTEYIGNILGLSSTTISNYLKKGLDVWGDFDYNPKEEKRKGSIKSGKLGIKRVAIMKNDKIIEVFPSVTELSLQSEKLLGVKLVMSGISQVCNGSLKQYKGFTFKYMDS